jgi:hypothetical protein
MCYTVQINATIVIVSSLALVLEKLILYSY